MRSMVFHARPDAAGKALIHVLVLVLNSSSDRYHITRPAVVRVHRTKHVVEPRPLLKIRVFYIGVDRKQSAPEFLHVVDVAALSCAAVKAFGQLIWRSEILILTVATCCETVVKCHGIPKEFARRAVFLITGVDVADIRAQQLWDLSISVKPAENILASRERVDDGMMIEMVRE